MAGRGPGKGSRPQHGVFHRGDRLRRVAGVVRRAVGADRDTLATRAEIDARITALRAEARADLYRALWAQGAGFVAVIAALNAAFEFFR